MSRAKIKHCFYTSWEILFVGKDEQETVLHFTIRDDAVELLSGLIYPVSVLRVNDKDQSLGASVVVSPQWSNLVLTTDVLWMSIKQRHAG